jgi:hypothetical protein
MIDPYRKISLNNLHLKVHRSVPGKTVTNIISEIRFWCEGDLIDAQRIKNPDSKGVHF